jgi:hypothetical protein
VSRRIYPTFEAFVQHHPMYMPNRYGGKCSECGQYVSAGKGNIIGKGKRSFIAHLPVAGRCEGAK